MHAAEVSQLSAHAGAYAAILRLYVQLDDAGRRQVDANVAAGLDKMFAAGWRQWRDHMLTSASQAAGAQNRALDDNRKETAWDQRAAA